MRNRLVLLSAVVPMGALAMPKFGKGSGTGGKGRRYGTGKDPYKGRESRSETMDWYFNQGGAKPTGTTIGERAKKVYGKEYGTPSEKPTVKRKVKIPKKMDKRKLWNQAINTGRFKGTYDEFLAMLKKGGIE